MARKLTKKQKDFTDEFTKTGNATRSALKVYNTEDYSTAGNIGSENLKIPKIQKAIADIIQETKGGTDKELINKLINIANQSEDKTNAVRSIIELLKLKGHYSVEAGTTLKEFLNKLK